MKKLLIPVIILAGSITIKPTSIDSIGPTEEAIHRFGIEDIYPKKAAEKFYGKKIKESPDWLGPDSFGEDIFYDEEEDIET